MKDILNILQKEQFMPEELIEALEIFIENMFLKKVMLIE